MKRTALLLTFTLALAGAAPVTGYSAEGDPLTAEQMPVLAAARIFALENHLRGDLGVADEDEAHIGERFEVNHAVTTDDKIDPCAFTMRKRNGPIVERIDFTRLANEVHVRPRGIYALVQIPGKKGAVCEIDGGKETSCTSGLEMLLMRDGNPSEMTLAARALRYIASVCPMVEPLF